MKRNLSSLGWLKKKKKKKKINSNQIKSNHHNKIGFRILLTSDSDRFIEFTPKEKYRIPFLLPHISLFVTSFDFSHASQPRIPPLPIVSSLTHDTPTRPHSLFFQNILVLVTPTKLTSLQYKHSVTPLSLP